MDQQHLPIPLLSKISSPTHASAVSGLPFIPLQWAEPTVTRAYSRRGNHTVYLSGVTPYIRYVTYFKIIHHGLKVS